MYKDTWLVLYLFPFTVLVLAEVIIREVTSGNPPPTHTLHCFVSFLFSYRHSCKPI